jgi:acyl-CoA reductase-like NAD-dependent aldehyde dehydrogenase
VSARCTLTAQLAFVAPWNYPISLALMPLATAIAAGNRSTIKPSEFTPKTSNLLAVMLADTFPDDQVAVVTGGEQSERASVTLWQHHRQMYAIASAVF